MNPHRSAENGCNSSIQEDSTIFVFNNRLVVSGKVLWKTRGNRDATR